MNIRKRGENLTFYNKKGLSHEIFFNVFELVLVAIIALSLYLFVSDVAEQTIFAKNYFARDLSLLINTLYSSPGQVSYDYEEDTNKFVFDFVANKLTVFREEEAKTNTNVFYVFAQNKMFPFDFKIIAPDGKEGKIRFFKTDSHLSVDKISKEPNTLSGENE